MISIAIIYWGIKMENRNVIIILVVIIAILGLAVGMMFLSPAEAKKECKIAIAGNSTLYEGDDLAVKLTDLNKTAIAGQSINVVITDKDGEVVVNESVKTNSKGSAKLDLELDAGNYSVNATFGGNDNYTGNSTVKKIAVKEAVQESVQESVQQSSTSSSSSSSSEYGAYINDEWVPMTESQYAERYPALYHMQTLDEGRYDEYHPEMYEIDRENGRDVDY